MLKKLGTLLNTVGSLGVGYYVGKLQLITNPSSWASAEAMTKWSLIGCVVLLAIGLLLRIRDIRYKKTEKLKLQGEVSSELNEIEHLEKEVDRYMDKANVTRNVLGNVLREIYVEGEIRDIVEEVINEKLRDPSDAARGVVVQKE